MDGYRPAIFAPAISVHVGIRPAIFVPAIFGGISMDAFMYYNILAHMFGAFVFGAACMYIAILEIYFD